MLRATSKRLSDPSGPPNDQQQQNKDSSSKNQETDHRNWELAQLYQRQVDAKCETQFDTQWKKGQGIIMILLLMLVLLVQGGFINYWIIFFNEGRSEWYFLFFADLVVVVTFVFSLSFAWRYYDRMRIEHAINPEIQHKIVHNIHRHDANGNRKPIRVLAFDFPQQMGMLPLIYVGWILYATILVAKIFIIFMLSIPQQMVKSGFRTPKEDLLLAYAASTLVFFFWVSAHWLMADDDHQQSSKGLVDDLVENTMFEIFDSLTFLDLITPDDEDEINVDDRLIGIEFRYTILVFAVVNFFIPVLGLFRLSRTRFGERISGVQQLYDELNGKLTTRGMIIAMIYHSCRLALVNVPFFVIRLFLSQNPKKEYSIFIVKNILGIIIAFRNLISEFKQWYKIHQFKQEVRLGRIRPDPYPSKRDQQTNAWQLPAMFDDGQQQQSQQQPQQRLPPANVTQLSVESNDDDSERNGGTESTSATTPDRSTNWTST